MDAPRASKSDFRLLANLALGERPSPRSGHADRLTSSSAGREVSERGKRPVRLVPLHRLPAGPLVGRPRRDGGTAGVVEGVDEE